MHTYAHTCITILPAEEKKMLYQLKKRRCAENNESEE